MLRNILIIILLFASIGYSQKDYYAKDVIKIVRSAGGTNRQIELDVFVKDYSMARAKTICAYYKNFYLTEARKLNFRLYISINLWSKKLSPGDILSSSDSHASAAKKKQYLILEKKYYHGGINYNYANDYYFEDIY